MASFDFWRVHVGVGQTWSLQNSLKWVYRFFWGTSPRRAPFPSWNHAAKEGENFYCTYHDWNLAELELHQSHQVWDVIGVGFWKELDEEIDLKILWKLEDRTLICLVSSNCNFCWKDTARSPIFDGWIIVFASSIHHFGWFNFIFHCPYSTTMKYHRHPSIFPGKISIFLHGSGPRHVAILLAEPCLHTGHGAAGRCSVDGWCERELGGGELMDPTGFFLGIYPLVI